MIPPNDDLSEMIVWLQEKRSISELCERFPEAWEAAKQEIAGSAKLNLINSFLVKKLFFTPNGQRKPVSMFWFKLLWPFIWQRNHLMRLVEFQGIYCFYSQQLIQELTKLIGSKSCLEIAAGDGTLSRFLKEKGTRVTAIDNRSWNFSINYPDAVIDCEAIAALQQYSPEVVICSWPPKNNNFERHVFQTESVQTYILIASHLESASGNWPDYRQQTLFSFTENKKLSKLVLPPELTPGVYVFQRFANDSSIRAIR